MKLSASYWHFVTVRFDLGRKDKRERPRAQKENSTAIFKPHALSIDSCGASACHHSAGHYGGAAGGNSIPVRSGTAAAFFEAYKYITYFSAFCPLLARGWGISGHAVLSWWQQVVLTLTWGRGFRGMDRAKAGRGRAGGCRVFQRAR